MSRPDFRVNDRLRLEIETPGDTTTGGQNNLVVNPDGAQGGYWWTSSNTCHVKSVPIDGDPTNTPSLTLYMDKAGAGHIATGYMPVTPGKYVAAQFTILTIQASHNVQATIEFEDASRTVVSTTTAVTFTTAATQYLTPVVVPAGAAYARIHIYYYSGTSGTANAALGDSFTFTNVAFSTGATNNFATVRKNLVPNPSFETNTTGWSASYSLGTGVTLTRVAGGHDGSYCARATVTGSDNIVSVKGYSGTGTRIPIQPSTDYTVSAWVKAPVGTQVHVTVAFWETATASVGRGTNVVDVAATGSWQRVSTTTTIDSTYHYASVSVSAVRDTLGTMTIDVDSVMLEKGTTLGAYFDGSTANGGGHTYAWTGTAHASTSTDTLSSWAYVPPFQYQNILGSANAISISREALNVGTLTATIVDPALDPATNPDVIAVGRRCRLMVKDIGPGGSYWWPLFTGFVDDAATAYVMDKDAGETKTQITLAAHDATQELANVIQPNGVGSVANLPGLLEGVAVPWNVDGNWDAINTFTTVANNADASLLDQVAIVRDISHGNAWVSSDGVLRVKSPAAETAYYVFQDTDPDGLSYSDIDVSFNTASVINSISVNSLKVVSTGETWNYSLGPYLDQNSIDKYGAYSATYTLQGMSDSAVATWAAQVLAANSVPVRKVNSITYAVTGDTTITAARAIDLGTVVGVTRTGIVSGSYRVHTITHSIQADADFDRWLVSYEFADPGSVATPQQIPTQSVPANKVSVGNMKTYGSPATWTKPDGIKSVRVRVWGAGGAGGGRAATTSGNISLGGGGGGGGYAEGLIPADLLPATVAIAVGLAGAGVNGGAGGAGGDSSFGTFLTAFGGGGGSTDTNTTTTTYSVAGGSGGSATASGVSGAFLASGQNGWTGYNSSAGAGFLWSSGAGGTAALGGAGGWGLHTGQTGGGSPGSVPGGGGGGNAGTSTASSGANGAPGRVIVEEIY